MTKRIISILSALLLIFSFASCNKKKEPFMFFAMNTFFTADIECGNDDIFSLLQDKATEMEKIFSSTDDASLVSKAGKGESIKGCEGSEALISLIKASLFAGKDTNGYFSPLLGKVTSLWNINGESFAIPDERAVSDALLSSDISNLTVSEDDISLENGARLDMGGCAKGYTADEFIKLFDENDVSRAVVSLGGNILCYSENRDERFKIGLRAPFIGDDSLCAVLNTASSVISVSGGYERYALAEGKTYHHIISPFTGYPAETDLACAVVISKKLSPMCGSLADCYSTALFAAGFDEALKIYENIKEDMYIILIKNDKTVYASEELKNLTELSDGYTFIR